MTPRRTVPAAATLLLLALSTALTAGALGAQPADGSSSLLGEEFVETMSTAIGPDGVLYHVRSGMHLDLFPDDPSAGWNNVLALDVIRGGELADRIVIPGTEGRAVESDSALLLDGGQLYVLWTRRTENDLQDLDLIRFTPETGAWGEQIRVSGDPVAVTGPPRLAVTREDVRVEEDDGTIVASTRTVVHVLWWEEPAQDQVAIFYTPIILTGGTFLGWNPVIELDASSFAEPGAGPAPDVSVDLLRAASLDRGPDARSLVIGLPDAATGRLYNLVVRLLPDGLTAVAEEARSHIIGIGRIQTGDTGGFGPGDLVGVAKDARSHIIGIGRVPMHRGVRTFIADQVEARILEAGASLPPSPGEDFWEELADAVWMEALEAGASLLGNQLRSEDLPCGLLHLAEIGMVGPGAEASDSLHQVEFCVSASLPLPETAATDGAEHRILTSEDGHRALVVWQGQDGSVHYRRSEGDGWSEALAVPEVAPELDAAVAILRSQIRLR